MYASNTPVEERWCFDNVHSLICRFSELLQIWKFWLPNHISFEGQINQINKIYRIAVKQLALESCERLKGFDPQVGVIFTLKSLYSPDCFLSFSYLECPCITWMSFLNVHRQKISHVTKLSHNAEIFSHSCSKNWTGPAAKVDHQWTVSLAKV